MVSDVQTRETQGSYSPQRNDVSLVRVSAGDNLSAEQSKAHHGCNSSQLENPASTGGSPRLRCKESECSEDAQDSR